MTIAEFLRALEREIPPGATYGSDPVGLQSGDPREELRGIMIAHDVDVATVVRAARRRLNLIICYHPVIYRPLARLDARDPDAAVPLALARHNITAYAVHTAFDTHREGTNMLLARALQLTAVRPLVALSGQSAKISVHVPAAAADRVAQAMWNAGAGSIGEYDDCSFRIEGTGTFRGSAASTPALGTRGRRETIAEQKIEMVCPAWNLGAVVAAMRAAHPYEEPAFDVVALKNDVPGIGMGAIGELGQPVALGTFIARVKKTTGAARVRTNGIRSKLMRRIAIVGGSGGSLLEDAVRQRADVLLTGDVRYHTFRAAGTRIAVIDAGHRETECCVVDGLAAIVQKLVRAAKNSHIRTARETTSTNPIIYV